MQVYTQSKTEINCIVIYHLPIKLKKKYLTVTILLIVKSLYNLAKTGNYQFAIFLDYYKKNLKIEMSFYDLYFLITKDSGENFGIIKLQTDNSLNVETDTLIKKKEIEIMEAKLKIQTQTVVQKGVLRNFNSYYMTIEIESIIIV